MQGSVQKRKTEIALWEMNQPKGRTSKKSGRKRPGDVDIIDLYPDGEASPVRRNRSGQPRRLERETVPARRRTGAAEPARRPRSVEPIGAGRRGTEEPYRRSRSVEPIGAGRRGTEEPYRPSRSVEPIGAGRRGTEEPYRRSRSVEPVGDGRRRTEEPAGHRRMSRPEDDEWDVDLIGQDWVEDPRRRTQSKKRRKTKKKRTYLYRTVSVCAIAFSLLIAYMAVDLVYDYTRKETKRRTVPVVNDIVVDEETQGLTPPVITEDFLEMNDFSRPGTKLPQVNSIFVHYTANPGTSAAQNRSYFANLAETQERSASAHFIIGYEGEIIQCMPLDEQAYAVMTRNEDSISIECCYLDEDGHFTQETYDSLVHLLAWLEQEYRLGSNDILRHYDCGGKKCPIYYVDHEEAWDKLLADVEAYKAEHE